jgi:hypothetical protein
MAEFLHVRTRGTARAGSEGVKIDSAALGRVSRGLRALMPLDGRLQWTLVMVAFAPFAQACGPCTENNVSTPVTPPIITVTNAATGQPICDAGVVAHSSAGPLLTSNDRVACSETLFWCPDASIPLVTFAPSDAASCPYGVAVFGADGGLQGIESVSGPPSILEVSFPGFRSATVPNVGGRAGDCTSAGQSPSPQIVTVALQPD